MIEFQLPNGRVTLIDEIDEHLLSAYRWNAMPCSRPVGKFYVHAHHNRKTIYLHRVIMQALPGSMIDHKNGDGLDNRRSNLRFCTPSQNAANSRNPIGAGGYRGIHRSDGGLWRTQVEKDGLIRRSRRFRTPEEAARLYDAWAKELFGEFAILNFPDAEAA